MNENLHSSLHSHILSPIHSLSLKSQKNLCALLYHLSRISRQILVIYRKCSYYTTLAEEADALRTKHSCRIAPVMSVTQTRIQITRDKRRNSYILHFISGETKT
jgi:hypothetical protein